MKIFAEINSIPLPDIGQQAFDALALLFPGGVWKGNRYPEIRVYVNTNDEKWQAAQKILEMAGLKPRGMNGPKTYSLEFIKEFEAADLESATLLKPCAPEEAWIGDFTCDAKGRVLVEGEKYPASKFTHDCIGLAAEWRHMLVKHSVRAALESSGLQHVRFTEAVFTDYEQPADWPDEPYWELSSDLTISPPVGKNQAAWDEPRPFEDHFRRVDIEKLPPFGLAFAPIAQGRKDGFLVASKNFYTTCVRHAIKLDWIPIIIDD
jgi:hypothetical protein